MQGHFSNRRRRARRLLGNETLEPRLVLSGFGDFAPPVDTGVFDFPQPFAFGFPTGDLAQLAVVGSDPADGAVVNQAINRLSITFDRAIDPFMIGPGDLLLERVNGDGETSLVTDPAVDVLEEQLDDTGTQLTLFLPASSMMEAGTYRLIISENAFLMGVDGSLLANIGTHQVVATFNYQPAQGATLSDAHSVGTLGPNVLRIDGHLDPGAVSNGVALYRFQLPEGHFWRLGAELAAQRLGSRLDAALSLFDESGQLLATADAGLPAAPNDPYLFKGLPPGTYYIGVSATGNIPGQPGGYDPISGTGQLGNSSQPGGDYRLRLVADPADTAERLMSIELTHANANDVAPTGFTLTFTGPVAPTIQGQPGIMLVDDAGNAWPVFLDGNDLSLGRIHYVLDTRLPVGNYRVVLASDGGLRDLAGLEPIGKDEVAHLLASFRIDVAASPRSDNDLGTIFPNDARATLLSGVSLLPGESLVSRMVVLFSYVCDVEFEQSGGPVRVEITNSTRGTTASFVLSGNTNSRRPIVFEAGEVFIKVSAIGDRAAELYWRVFSGNILQERVDTAGAGLDSALSLRLVASPAAPVSTLPAIGSNSGSQSGPLQPQSDPPIPREVGGAGGGIGPVFDRVATPTVTNGAQASPGFVTVGITVNAATNTNAPQLSSVNIALLNASGGLVGRSTAATDVDFAGQSGQFTPSAVATEMKSALLPGQDAWETGKIAHARDEEEHPPAPHMGEGTNDAHTDGSITDSELAALGRMDDFRWPVDSERTVPWVSATIAEVQRWLFPGSSANEPVRQHEQLASVDPISRVLAALGGEQDDRATHADPILALIATATVIEGRRLVARWLGKRKNLRALVGRSGGLPSLIGA